MAEQRPVLVSVVEDDAEMRGMLAEVLMGEPGLRLLHTYRNAEEALAHVPEPRADVLVADINLPGKDGIECVRQLAERDPGCQFLIYTVQEDDRRIFEALRNGASGFLLKSSTPAEIVAAIREVYVGGAPMSTAIARRVVDWFRQRPTMAPLAEARLGERESQVLQMLAEGLLYKEIGTRLGISIGTVKNHCYRIYEKLRVQNRTEAVNRYFGR